MRRKRVPPYVLPIIAVLIGGMLLFGLKVLLYSADRHAKSVVTDFYAYEADGNFADSWALLHPFMKERFSKTAYIQDRAHVFIGHFGAETFTYTIGEAEEIEGWKMEKDRPPFGTAYKYQVTQNYQGKYGKFSFQQEVYVVETKENWQILWDYNQ